MIASPRRTLVLVAALAAFACGGGNNTTSPSGITQLQIVDLNVGTGATAANGSTVSVTYTGWLYDGSKADAKGTVFDSNVGGALLVFQLGNGQTIAGFEQGIVGMKVGGQRRITIPPDLAYGAAGRPPAIPGNATLIFEVQLIAVS